MITLSISAKLEALLFISGEPIALGRLKGLLGINAAVLEETLIALTARYADNADSGLMLIRHRDRVELATKPEIAPVIEALNQVSRQDALSKAALEVLSIVAYRAPIARSDIEAIRGVNCSYTLRTLLVRGVIERQGNPEDARGYLYQPSVLFLEQLGLGRREDLPQFKTLSADERMMAVTPSSSDLERAEPINQTSL